MVTTLMKSTEVPSRRRPTHWLGRLVPWVWIAPALLFIIIFLLYPVVYTLYLSFFNFDSSRFAGLANYGRIFTDSSMLEVIKNNLLWLVLGTTATVALGLVFAVLVDRVRMEGLAKAIIFVPMAISFAGAAVIWTFVYDYSSPGQPQIGLLNALMTAFGAQPQAWLISPAI